MAIIVLLSCTKSKLNKPSQAQDLYSVSPMFQKTLEYGKSLKPDKMYILSAKHYLVPLTKVLAPYDKTLKEMPKDEKEAWGEKYDYSKFKYEKSLIESNIICKEHGIFSISSYAHLSGLGCDLCGDDKRHNSLVECYQCRKEFMQGKRRKFC